MDFLCYLLHGISLSVFQNDFIIQIIIRTGIMQRKFVIHSKDIKYDWSISIKLSMIGWFNQLVLSVYC